MFNLSLIVYFHVVWNQSLFSDLLYVQTSLYTQLNITTHISIYSAESITNIQNHSDHVHVLNKLKRVYKQHTSNDKHTVLMYLDKKRKGPTGFARGGGLGNNDICVIRQSQLNRYIMLHELGHVFGFTHAHGGIMDAKAVHWNYSETSKQSFLNRYIYS
jgi:hypothetical protein